MSDFKDKMHKIPFRLGLRQFFHLEKNTFGMVAKPLISPLMPVPGLCKDCSRETLGNVS